MELNDHLREMLKELGQAINESISGSDRVHDSIQKIREEGYNLYMVLDAKVGVNRREARARGPCLAAPGRGASSRSSNESPRATRAPPSSINVKDVRILKSLGIDPTRKVRPARHAGASRPARAARAAASAK